MKKTFPYKAIGNRIRLLRGKLSQREFSMMIGISLRAYQRYEHGERLPSFEILLKLSSICPVTLTWIMKGSIDDEIKINGEDFADAVNKLDYIFNHGSFELIDFFNKILTFASNISRNGLDYNAGDDLTDFLISLTDISLKELRKTLKNKWK